MLTFFTDPYRDEILYSAIARYHYYVGNIDYKDTLREVFGSDSVIPSIELSSHLEFLANNLAINTHQRILFINILYFLSMHHFYQGIENKNY